MTSKFWFLTKQSLNKKIKTKWFVLANVLLAIVIVGMINMNTIISFFGGDFSTDTEIVLLDETKSSSEIFEATLDETKKSLSLETDFIIESTTKSEDELEEELKDNNKIGIILSKDDEAYLKAKIVSNEKIDNLSYQVIVQALNTTKTQIALVSSSIDPVELQKITSAIEVERLILDDSAKSEDENMAMIMGTVFPTIILPFFMLVVFLVQMIGTEINEEKTTKSMEIIISNVSPKVHFFSKVLASNAFILIQGVLLILYAVIGLLILNSTAVTSSSSVITDSFSSIWDMLLNSGIVDRLPEILGATLVLMILSFVAYSLVAGILASMTVNMEDFQQVQTPIMMICMLGYFLSIMAGMFEGSVFIKFFAYMPFISCLLAPALLVIGQITLIDVAIAIVLLLVLIYLLVKYGLRIYKVGILNYSTDKLWQKFWIAARKGE